MKNHSLSSIRLMAIKREAKLLPRMFLLFHKKKLNPLSLTKLKIKLMQTFQTTTVSENKNPAMVESFLISTTPVTMSPKKSKVGK